MIVLTIGPGGRKHALRRKRHTMRKTALILIFVLFSFFLELSAQEPGNLSNSVSQEEYQVYSDVLGQLADRERACVIREKTTVDWRNKLKQSPQVFLKGKFGQEIDDNLIRQFIVTNNSRPGMLENKFSSSLNAVIIPEKEFSEIFAPGSRGWKKFYSQYPNFIGFIELSRVVFDSSKTKALLSYGLHFSSGWGGYNSFALLKKQNYNWVIENEIKDWIS